MKYLSPLLLFGLNGVVILNGVSGGTRSAVFFSVLLLGETLTPARWLGAAMVLGSAMLAEFVHPRKQRKRSPRLPRAKCKTSG